MKTAATKVFQFQDLKDPILHPESKGEILYCDVCQEEFSACKGDYFMEEPWRVITCCNETPMRIVRRVTKLVDARCEEPSFAKKMTELSKRSWNKGESR